MLNVVAKKIFSRLGIEAVRAATFRNFIATRPIDLVVDVGGNLGQFAEHVRESGYADRIHSFEPVGKVFAALERRAARDQHWQVTRAALGAAPGEVQINLYDNHTLNSLHALDHDAAQRLAVDPRVIGTETVPIATLDDMLADDPAQSVFLKIDTQGHERAVLEGASATLARTTALLLELPVVPLYEGSWSFNEALAHIDALGFAPAQFRAVNTMADDPASAIEFDCLFRRK
ncbi:FkbM family methyltransferase [Sphingomonas sp. NPDC079357]|uniref:FkbM family methyltransferase n=1 Tax=Sphingomonas sp. NPDC079357 TaxID=3364518 RepID=UPI00384EED1B